MLENKVTTILIGKNETELKHLGSVLKKFHQLVVVGSTTSAVQGYSMVNNFAPQLLIITIELNGTSGLQFAKTLPKKIISPEFIFVSKDTQHVLHTMQFSPLDYWTSIDNRTIEQMIERLKFKLKKKELDRKMDAYSKIHAGESKRVFKTKNGIAVVKLSEIVYSKASLTKATLKLVNDDEIELKTTIGETLETINNDTFIRISRSFAINQAFLRKIDKKKLKCLMYHDGTSWEVPVSKNNIKQLEKLNVFQIY